MTDKDSIGTVRGIGPKKQALFEKLSIRTLRDAQEFYPRDYQDRTRFVPIAALTEGEKAAVYAVVGTEPTTSRVRKGLEITRLRVFDRTGTLWLTYYNNRYGAAVLHMGSAYVFYGKVQGSGARRTMIAPESERVLEGKAPPRRLYPIYPLTAGLTQRDILRVIDAALTVQADGDWLPRDIAARHRLVSHEQAVQWIHRPPTTQAVQAARRRLIFEELFLLCCGLAGLKDRRTAVSGLRFSKGTPEDF